MSSGAGMEPPAEAGGIFGAIKEWTNGIIMAPDQLLGDADASEQQQQHDGDHNNNTTDNGMASPTKEKKLSTRVRSLSPFRKVDSSLSRNTNPSHQQQKQMASSSNGGSTSPALVRTASSATARVDNGNKNNSNSHIPREEGRDKARHPMARMRKALGKRAKALSPSAGRRNRSSSRSRSAGKADGTGTGAAATPTAITNSNSIACGASPARWGVYNDTITVQPNNRKADHGGGDNDDSNRDPHAQRKKDADDADAAAATTADGNANTGGDDTDLVMAGCAPGAAVGGDGGGALAFGPVQLLQRLMSQNCMTAPADLSSLKADIVGSSDNDDDDDDDDRYDDRSRFTRDDSYSEDEDGSEYTSASEYDEGSYVSETTGASSAAPSYGSSRKSGRGGRSSRRGRSLGPSPRSRDFYTNSEKKRGSGRHTDRSRRRNKGSDGGASSGARGRSGGKRGDDKDVAEEGSTGQKKYDESESAAGLSSASNIILASEVEEDLSVIGRSLGGGVIRDRTATSANKNKDTIVEKEVDVKDTTAQTKDEDAAVGFVTEGSILKAFVEQITKEGCPLIWHKVQDSNLYMRPTSIRAFMSLEDAADEFSHMNPCLFWDVIEDSNTTGVATSGGEPTRGSIGLFDISSVEKAGLMNLTSYPFAIPGNSFFVTLNNGGVILFEAKDEIEQKKFIQGLRWVVARLAFNLIVGNRRICTELLNYGGGEDNVADAEHEARTMDDVTNHLVDKSIELLAAKKDETK